jgi:hypothetical protein
MAVLEGDPRAAGSFTIRLLVPAGASIPPHWHPREERVTVLAGAVELGFGRQVDANAIKRYGPGSSYVSPPREFHYLFFLEGAELQVSSIGPWERHTSDLPAAPKPAAPAKPKANPNANATVQIVSSEPAARAKLAGAQQLAITVKYDITGFTPETYSLEMLFEGETPGSMYSPIRTTTYPAGTEPPRSTPDLLKTRSGQAVVTAGVDEVVGNSLLKRPLRGRVFVVERTTGKPGRVIGQSGWIAFGE